MFNSISGPKCKWIKEKKKERTQSNIYFLTYSRKPFKAGQALHVLEGEK